MTLIACTLNYKRPFIVGDLLISSPKAKKSIQLPSNKININEYLEPRNSYATGLYQKIYVINQNVAIALAGNVSEMTKLLKEFIIRCSYFDPIDEKGIRTFIEEYDIDSNFADSAFFIMLMVNDESSISVKQFWWPNDLWKKSESEVFEEVYACGTGADDFIYNASEQQTFEASAENGNIYRAIATNFAFIAKLLAIERVSLYTINKNWGGGFETIIFGGNSFLKLDQIAYITCHCQFDENGDFGFPFPQLLQYYEYYKDVLFISSIEVKEWRQEEKGDQIVLQSDNYRADLFPIPRLDMNKGSLVELPPDFSFTTNRVSLGYAIITKSNRIYAPSFFSESNSLQVTFHDGKYVEVILSKKVTELLKEKARSVFPIL
jgi:hypothetical protein